MSNDLLEIKVYYLRENWGLTKRVWYETGAGSCMSQKVKRSLAITLQFAFTTKIIKAIWEWLSLYLWKLQAEVTQIENNFSQCSHNTKCHFYMTFCQKIGVDSDSPFEDSGVNYSRVKEREWPSLVIEQRPNRPFQMNFPIQPLLDLVPII